MEAPVVTALRQAGRGRVAVELDGAPWRTVPLDAAVRAELVVGLVLDRDRLRTLARELRRSRALGVAAGALRHRDLSRRALEQRLARRGIRHVDRTAAVAVLERAGLVDDERAARARATALAERGWGDLAIAHRLESEGLAGEHAAAAVASLAPERARAAAIVARRGPGPPTARFLARRGFGEEAVEEAVSAER